MSVISLSSSCANRHHSYLLKNWQSKYMSGQVQNFTTWGGSYLYIMGVCDCMHFVLSNFGNKGLYKCQMCILRPVAKRWLLPVQPCAQFERLALPFEVLYRLDPCDLSISGLVCCSPMKSFELPPPLLGEVKSTRMRACMCEREAFPELFQKQQGTSYLRVTSGGS